MARTPSMVQFADVCAARIRSPPAAQHRLTIAKRRKSRRLKRGLYPVKMRQFKQALGILTYTKRCANAPQGYPETSSCLRSERRLTVNFHLVGNHRALVITQWFDFGDREISAVQFRQRLLQRGVQVILKSELCRRGQDAGIHAIRQPVSLLRDNLDLPRCDRRSALRFVVEPVPWREKHEDQNQDDRDVILPRAALVRPEKRPGKNLAKACHINPQAPRRR